MFKALRMDTKESLFSLNYDKSFLKELFQKELLVCPDCGSRVNVRSGTKIQHFYHYGKVECTNIFGEPETFEHLNGKLILLDRLRTLYPDALVEMEFRIEETNQ